MTTPEDAKPEPLFPLEHDLPEEAFQLGKTYQLGKPQEQYKSEFAFFAGCLVLVALAIIGPVILAGGLGSSQGILAIVIVLLVFFLALLSTFLQRKWRVYVYTDGFVYIKGKLVQALRWDEIELVRQFSFRRTYRYGTSTRANIWIIRSKKGEIIQFGDELYNVKALMDTIEAHVGKVE